MIVQDFETGDPLDLLGNLGVEFFLPGDPQVANLVGAPALDQCLLDVQESATKDDNQEIVVHVGLPPSGPLPKKSAFILLMALATSESTSPVRLIVGMTSLSTGL